MPFGGECMVRGQLGGGVSGVGGKGEKDGKEWFRVVVAAAAAAASPPRRGLLL